MKTLIATLAAIILSTGVASASLFGGGAKCEWVRYKFCKYYLFGCKEHYRRVCKKVDNGKAKEWRSEPFNYPSFIPPKPPKTW